MKRHAQVFAPRIRFAALCAGRRAAFSDWLGFLVFHRKNIACHMLLAALLWGMCGSGIATAAEARSIEQLTVRVEAATSLPLAVERRMESSVQAIAEQLLLGQKLAAYEERREKDETLIRDVFDRVLVGYTVSEVSITADVNTRIRVTLLPWQDTIEAVETDIAVESLEPPMASLVLKDMEGVDEIYADTLLGLPLAATDWVQGVLKERIQRYLDEHLPEFRADFDIEPGREAKVKLLLYPRLPVIRSVDLSMRSSSIPNFTLLAYRGRMQREANHLLGVPVAFVKRHARELAEDMAHALDEEPGVRALTLQTQVSYRIGEKTAVETRSDTKAWKLRTEGWADIGRKDAKDRDIRFRVHAGKYLSDRDELFYELDFYPQENRWRHFFGYERELFPRWWAALKYDTHEHGSIAAFRTRISPKLQLRYEYRDSERMSEVGLSYYLHGFLRLELVKDEDDEWLRLIGDF
ncbi:hypothetical protein [Selenomonas sp. TAMA-11512]|uniref:hypothetical protein n=1 Tax=Selenomonas sp. TAMA-11512 TaxID=3095337 RepID=UPI0030D04D80